MSAPAQSGDDIDHGTCAGYRQHHQRAIPPCAGCRAANAAYSRRYRAARFARQLREKPRRDAYQRALERLREAHPVEFERIHAEELG